MKAAPPLRRTSDEPDHAGQAARVTVSSDEITVVRKPETLQALAGLGGYVAHLRGAALGMVLVMPGEWPEGETFDEGRLAERTRKPISELVHEERYRA
jgi:hypothetical protein